MTASIHYLRPRGGYSLRAGGRILPDDFLSIERKQNPARKSSREHDIVIDWIEFVIMATTITTAFVFAGAAFLIAMGWTPGAYR